MPSVPAGEEVMRTGVKLKRAGLAKALAVEGPGILPPTTPANQGESPLFLIFCALAIP